MSVRPSFFVSSRAPGGVGYAIHSLSLSHTHTSQPCDARPRNGKQNTHQLRLLEFLKHTGLEQVDAVGGSKTLCMM